MYAGSIRHSMIATATLAAVYARLDLNRFAVGRGDLKVIANGVVRYPDVVVFRFPEDLDADVAPTPVVVMEVVAPATRMVDRFDKNVDYAGEPSIQHYLMLAEDQRSAVLCSRTGGEWVSADLAGDDPVVLTAIGVELNFDDIYRRITFGNVFP